MVALAAIARRKHTMERNTRSATNVSIGRYRARLFHTTCEAGAQGPLSQNVHAYIHCYLRIFTPVILGITRDAKGLIKLTSAAQGLLFTTVKHIIAVTCNFAIERGVREFKIKSKN